MAEPSGDLPRKDVAVRPSTPLNPSTGRSDVEAREQDSGAMRLARAVRARLDTDAITITPLPDSGRGKGTKTVTVIDSADSQLHVSLCEADNSERTPGEAAILGTKYVAIRWFDEARKTAGEITLGNSSIRGSSEFRSVKGDIPEEVCDRERARWDLAGGGYAYFADIWTTNKTGMTDSEYDELAAIIEGGHVNESMVADTKRYFSESTRESNARFESFHEKWYSSSRSLPSSSTDTKAITDK